MRLLVLGALSATVILTGCTTIKEETITLAQYNKDIGVREAELDRLRILADRPAASPVVTNIPELFPPEAVAGHCYARMLTPASYREWTEQVLLKEATERVEVLPGEYKDGSERILVREASTKIVAMPATYKTVSEEILVQAESKTLVPYPAEYGEASERVLVKAATTELIAVPAKFEQVTERVLDKPAHTVWKRGSGFADTAIETSFDQSTGEIMCLVDVPATYKTVTRTVQTSPASTKTVTIPAEYKTIGKKKLIAAAGYREEIIPAKYQTITQTVVDVPAHTREIEIPAEYQQVDTRVTVREPKTKRITIPAEYGTVSRSEKLKDEVLAWTEIICQDNINPNLVTELQTALNGEGHYNGPIDGIYGSLTQRGVQSYAKAKQLAIGDRYIPLATAEALGIKL